MINTGFYQHVSRYTSTVLMFKSALLYFYSVQFSSYPELNLLCSEKIFSIFRMVHACTSDADFVAQTNDRTKVYCVDFFAEWCGPCKVIAPFFASLADQYPDVTFLKVDIEKCEATANR